MSDLWQYLTLTGEPVTAGPTKTEPTHVEEPLPLDLPKPVVRMTIPDVRSLAPPTGWTGSLVGPVSPVVDVLDAVGIGIGLDNLGMAALADGVPGLAMRLFDERPRFSPAPDRPPVSFLADLVTLVEPSNPWSYLCYLRAHQRIHPFYVNRRFELPRREYDEYCRWVATTLPGCRFGTRVDAVSWTGDHFAVRTARVAEGIKDEPSVDGDGVRTTVLARNIVLGGGQGPELPRFLRPLAGLIHGGRLTACDDDHRVRLDRAVTGKLFLQRATPGSTPDRDAYRNAEILNQIAGRDVFPPTRPPAA